MNMSPSKLIPALVPLLLLAGCGAPVDHPSLAPRAIEKGRPAPAPAAPVAQPVVDGALGEKIAGLVDQAKAAGARFDGIVDDARQAVARASGAAPGSEAWVAAEQAVTRLDSAREPIGRVLADLDAIALANPTAVPPSLDPAVADVSALDSRTREAVTGLRDRLSAP